MNDLKAYYITDGNTIKDMIIGTEDEVKQTPLTTLDFIEKDNESWLKHKIVTVDLEGQIHKGHTNIITTIKMNGTPIRSIANNFQNVVAIVEDYISNDNNDYRKYSYITEFIKM